MPSPLALAIVAVLQAPQEPRPPEPPPQRAVLIEGVGEVHFPVTSANAKAQRFFDQGMAYWYGGSPREAERAFREVAILDPGCVMAHWGMALATMDDLPRAAGHAWNAYRQRDKASQREQRYIEGWAHYLGAETEPPKVGAPEFGDDKLRLVDDLKAIAETFPDDVDARALALAIRLSGGVPFEKKREPREALLAFVLERAPRHPIVVRTAFRVGDSDTLTAARSVIATAPSSGAAWRDAARFLHSNGHLAEAVVALEAAARVDRRLMRLVHLFPYEVEHHYRGLIELAAAQGHAGMREASTATALRLVELPTHPHLVPHVQGLAGTMARSESRAKPPRESALTADLDALGPARWSWPEAPAFQCPRPGAAPISLQSYRGKPVLVVFFLGFGCLHCVEQLKSLAPQAGAFDAAGIEIVTIGTDTLDQVRASIQQGIENDDPPLPFPVLCDPKGEAFKRYRCWDWVEDEALHGTYLVDPEGRVRWQDISVEPFMETEWLLGECRRLLAQPVGESVR